MKFLACDKVLRKDTPLSICSAIGLVSKEDTFVTVRASDASAPAGVIPSRYAASQSRYVEPVYKNTNTIDTF